MRGCFKISYEMTLREPQTWPPPPHVSGYVSRFARKLRRHKSESAVIVPVFHRNQKAVHSGVLCVARFPRFALVRPVLAWFGINSPGASTYPAMPSGMICLCSLNGKSSRARFEYNPIALWRGRGGFVNFKYQISNRKFRRLRSAESQNRIFAKRTQIFANR
jgi:hypothetical protein